MALSHTVCRAAVMSHGEPQREPRGSLRKVGPAWGCQVGMSCPLGASCRMSLFTGGGRKAPRERTVVGVLVYPAPAVPPGSPRVLCTDPGTHAWQGRSLL